MIARRYWIYALLLAVALHLGGLVAVLAQSEEEGAVATGELGMEIDLGMLGDLGEASETVVESAPQPVPPLEQAAEPLPEQPAEPVREVPPAVKVEPPPPARQQAELRVKSKPEPKPVSKPEPKPQPEKTEPVPARVAPQAAAKPTAAEPNQAQRKMSTGKANALSTGGSPAAQRSYFALLASKLARHKRYPVTSRRRGEEGIVKLAFELDRSGAVLSFSIAESSGFKRLDEAVLDMLKKAQPLPPFPEQMTQQRLTIKLPVEFSLQDKS